MRNRTDGRTDGGGTHEQSDGRTDGIYGLYIYIYIYIYI